eukprot:symbB.v1.2.003904.t1/scaffold199.1/size273374/9
MRLKASCGPWKMHPSQRSLQAQAPKGWTSELNLEMDDTASVCCHVERLPRQQLSVAAAPASGPRPGLQDESFEENYHVLDSGSDLDQSTWVHTKGVRTHDVKGAHNDLLYTCLRIQKNISPLQEQGLQKHLKVLCGISHPHLCKVVECFNSGDERILICEKPPSERFFSDDTTTPWTYLEGREKQEATDVPETWSW